MPSEDAPRIMLERCKRNIRKKLRVKVGARAKKTERERKRERWRKRVQCTNRCYVLRFSGKKKNKATMLLLHG